MLTDAHCHPRDLENFFPGAEEERRRRGICCAASATDREGFEYHEGLAQGARKEGAPPVLSCFAVHPQLPAARPGAAEIQDLLDALASFAGRGRLDAVGETGFDLYHGAFRETEALQDELFRAHLETALRCDLPVALHIRRAMHKVFGYARELRKISAVIFHSYSGTLGEGRSLLNRGINAFFSFGTIILLNHKEARRCCGALPEERLLLETDAPYQPLRGNGFSSWADLPAVLQAASALRREAGQAGGDPAELEQIVEKNFFKAFQGNAQSR